MASPSDDRGAPPQADEGFIDPYVNYVRDHFAQRSIHPDQLPDIMFKHIYTGAMGNVWGTLIAGVFFVYFGNAIGLTKFEWGLMSAIGSWVLLSEVLSAAITQRLGHRKALWLACATADRSLRFIAIMAALLLWHMDWPHAGLVLVCSITLATCLGAMAGPPWLSWLADLIPEREHGEFWGRRSAWINVAVVCTTLPAALYMDRLPEDLKLRVTIWIFALATIIGLLDLVIHSTIPEPKMARPKESDFFRQFLAPLRDRGFRPFLVFSFSWTFSVMVGATLITVFIMEDLGGKKNLFGMTLAMVGAYLLGGMLTAKWTGSLVDKWGPKRVMRMGYFFWAIIPVCWFFLTPSSVLWVIGAVNFVAGFFVTAASNASLKIQTRYPPASHRAMYIAVSNCANYVAAGLAALVAAFMARQLEHWSWTLDQLTFTSLDVFAGVSLVLRVATANLFISAIREHSDPES